MKGMMWIDVGQKWRADGGFLKPRSGQSEGRLGQTLTENAESSTKLVAFYEFSQYKYSNDYNIQLNFLLSDS